MLIIGGQISSDEEQHQVRFVAHMLVVKERVRYLAHQQETKKRPGTRR